MSRAQSFHLPAPAREDPGGIAMLVGGSVLAFLGLRRGGVLGAGLALAGGALAWRGASGLVPVQDGLATLERALPATHTVKIRRSITIGRPREEVWRYLRDLTNFPRFARHVESVTPMGERRSRWVVHGPGGARLAWDSEIESEVENERLSWRSVEGADIRHAGVLGLRDAPGGRGTEVHVRLAYDAPAGALGRLIATLLGEEPDLQARDDLGRLKQLLETGETATNALRRDDPAGERP